MRGISVYIFKQLATGVVLVTTGLLALIWLTQSLRYVEMIMSKGLSALVFVQLTVLLLPNFLVIVLPIALFAVTVFTYNRMNSDRELVVLKAAGMSPLELGRPAIVFGLICMAFGWFLTLHYVPKSVLEFRELRWKIRHDVSQILFTEGEFNQVAKGVTVYVRNRGEDGSLHGIMVHDERKQDRTVTLMADKGTLVQTPRGPRVVMLSGSRQEVKNEGGQFSMLYFDRYTMELGGTRDDGGVRFRDARERTMHELLTQQKIPELLEVDIRRFRVEAHKRLTLPLYNLGFVLIALAGLLTGNFDRRGQTKRVVATVAVMVLFQASVLGAENVATQNLVFIPLIYFAALLPIVGGFYALVWYNPMRARTPSRLKQKFGNFTASKNAQAGNGEKNGVNNSVDSDDTTPTEAQPKPNRPEPQTDES